MGIVRDLDDNFKNLSQEEKIIKCIQSGCTYRQIQLECGSPSRKEIKRIIKDKLPELHKYLNDTKLLKKERDGLWNNYINYGSE